MKKRWRGEVPLNQVFWIDMLLIGTLINMLATFAALIVASQGGSGPLAALVNFAPVPLNLWLAVVVLRARGRTPVTSAVAAVWFVVMSVV